MNKQSTNSKGLHIWIAENGDQKARELIIKEAKMCQGTLSRIISGHMPRFPIRYRIFKLTGVKLNREDDFTSSA